MTVIHIQTERKVANLRGDLALIVDPKFVSKHIVGKVNITNFATAIVTQRLDNMFQQYDLNTAGSRIKENI